MREMSDDLKYRLSEVERLEQVKLHRSEWYQNEINPHVRAAVDASPPNYIYLMKDTQQFVYIVEYLENKEDRAQPVFLQVMLDRKYNAGMTGDTPNRLIILAPHVVERIELRSIVDATSTMAEAQRKSVFMPDLANRKQAMLRTRKREAEQRLDRIIHKTKKGLL